MTQVERELWAARLTSGRVRIKVPVGGEKVPFVVRPPTPYDRLVAAEAAAEASETAALMGLQADEEALSLLVRTGQWTDEQAGQLRTAEEDLEKVKVRLYREWGKKELRAAAKATLASVRSALSSLNSARYANSSLTADAHAAAARLRALVGQCLCHPDGSQAWAGEAYWDASGPLLDKAVEVYQGLRPSETTVREVARTEPWRSVWAARNAGLPTFPFSAAELTDDQRSLVTWSRIYDAAYEDPDGPPDDLVEDDDALDGWLIVRRREREEKMKSKTGESLVGNERIAKAGEVMVINARPGEAVSSLTSEDVAAVESLNSEEAALTKRQREHFLAKQGAALEAEMPDSKLKILAQFHRQRGGGQ